MHTLADDAVRLLIDTQCVIRSVRSETAVVYPSSHHPCCIEFVVHNEAPQATAAASLALDSSSSSSSSATFNANASSVESTLCATGMHIYTSLKDALLGGMYLQHHMRTK
jgi:hypothetical protein